MQDSRSSLDYENIDLKKELVFLKSELDSKNTVINILKETIKSLEHENSKSSTNSGSYNLKHLEHQKDEFMTPKRFVRGSKNKKTSNDIKMSNRYSAFNKDNNNTVKNTRSEHNSLENNKTNQNVNITNKKRNEKKNKPSITIIGDSLLKDIKSYELKKAMDYNANVYVKCFSGATVEDMESYIIPMKKRKPDVAILHFRTNNLHNKTEKPKEIADKILKLAKSIHSDSTTVVISALAPRNDNFDHKRVEVNHYFKLESSKCNVAFIEHDNID